MLRSLAGFASYTCLALAALGCGLSRDYAQTALDPDASRAHGDCPDDLAERIRVTDIEVDTDIRYKASTYDNLPIDERVGFGVTRDGRGYVAWLDPQKNIRVTPLDSSMQRREPDILVNGDDIGGFTVTDDGFALLTGRADPGEPLTEPDGTTTARAVFLVGYRGREEAFAVPLTGTASITRESYPGARDCAPRSMYGRLSTNGVKYGAYFQVRGCLGDPHEGFYGDKLVYVTPRGEFVPGGWDWNCSTNLGLRLVAEADAFTAICISDTLPTPGLNLVTAGVPARQLSPEFTSAAYAAATFGSLVKLPADGSYAIAWLSRGLTTASGRARAAKTANDVAFLRLDLEYARLGRKQWPVETANVAEANLHLAPYGRDRLLLIWDEVSPPRCDPRICLGPYAGTLARLMDLDGQPLGSDWPLTTPPNTGEDLAVFPNGDLGWAFVPDPERSYQPRIFEDRNGLLRLPSRRVLQVARMRVCE